MGIKYFTDLEVYQLTEKLAMDIFRLSLKFPIEEKYSLSDQIRRSSRSIAANIAEGWGKKYYSGLLKRRLVDSLGSLEETRAWIRFARKCNYISEDEYLILKNKCEVIGKKLFLLYKNWK